MMIAAPIMCVGGIIMALRQDVGLAWLIVVSVGALVLAIGMIVSRMVPQFRRMQTRIDMINRVYNTGSMKAAGIAGNAVGLFFDALVVAISVQGHCGLRQLACRCE